MKQNLDTTIQARVYTSALELIKGYNAVSSPFCIEDVQIHLYCVERLTLTYKQVRNALYRLRDNGEKIRHEGRGKYWLDQPSKGVLQ